MSPLQASSRENYPQHSACNDTPQATQPTSASISDCVWVYLNGAITPKQDDHCGGRMLAKSPYE